MHSVAAARAPLVRPRGLLEFLEALYHWDTSEEDWLRGLSAALLKVVPSGLWVQAHTYDVSDDTYKCRTLITHRGPPSLGEHFLRETTKLTPALIARCMRATSVTTVRTRSKDENHQSRDALESVERETGARSILIVNGLDPSGRSAALHVGLPSVRPPSGGAVHLLRRMASHLASAARARRSIVASAHIEAVPTSSTDVAHAPETRPQHADVAVRGREERELTQAIRSHEVTREQRDLPSWRPLVDARWTLVDVYESDGARHVVVRETPADVHALGILSERERQVVACLAFGQTTKEIAYTLSIDASTARVLLQRAARKLAVPGRAGLLDHPAVKAMRSAIDAADLAHLRAPRDEES